MDNNVSRGRKKPSIECLVTTKMSTVSARIKVILDDMLTKFCRDNDLHIYWLKRTDGMSSKTKEIARVRQTLKKIKKECQQTEKRAIIVIDEDDNTRAWWKAPMHNIFHDVRYAATFCEMCSSGDMKDKVIEEQKTLGIEPFMALNTINKTIDEYIHTTKTSVENMSCARLRIEFGFVGDYKYRVLFPTKKSMTAIARRLFQSLNWMDAWYNECRNYEENLPENRLDGSDMGHVNKASKQLEIGMPQIQCFITTKMDTVSDKTPKLFSDMIQYYCHTYGFRMCHVKRLRETPTSETTRIRELFNSISIDAMDPNLRIVVLIEEDTSDNTDRWWKEPFHAALKGKYSLTFIEMCTTKPMEDLVIHEQEMLGVQKSTTINLIDHTIQNYVLPKGQDFPNIDLANIQIHFNPIQSATRSILFPSKECLKVLGRRLFMSNECVDFWISFWVRKSLRRDVGNNPVLNNKGTSNHFVNQITTEIMNSINM